MTISQRNALGVIVAFPDLSRRQLAARLRCSANAASQLVFHLRLEGLVDYTYGIYRATKEGRHAVDGRKRSRSTSGR